MERLNRLKRFLIGVLRSHRRDPLPFFFIVGWTLAFAELTFQACILVLLIGVPWLGLRFFWRPKNGTETKRS